MKRSEGLLAFISGFVVAVSALAAATYIEIGGVTYGGFYIGVVVGLLMMGLGLIGMTGLLRDKPKDG